MIGFYFLLAIGLVALWFLLSFIYKPLGRFLGRIWDDSMEAMTEEDIDNNKTKE